MSPTAIVVVLACAAIVVCATGVVLTVRRRPYGLVLQNVHKLVALAAVIAVSFIAYRGGMGARLDASAAVSAVSAAVLLLVAFVSGGVVSGRTDPPEWVMWVHRASSWLSIVAAVAIVDLLVGRL